MDALRQDLKHSFRMLTHRPGWTAAAVATLAVGIGATTAIYSFVDGVLIRPLPYPSPDRIVAVRQVDAATGEGLDAWTYPWYEAWRSEQDVLEDFGAYADQMLTLNLADRSERVPGAMMTAAALDVLGARPILGRTLRPEEDVDGGLSSVLLSEEVWRTRYGARPDIIGTTVTLNERPRTVVGVLPAAFDFPEPETEYWLSFSSAYRGAGTAYLHVVARVPETLGLAGARAGLARSTRVEPSESGATELRLTIEPLQASMVGDSGRVLLMFLAAVAVLLLVGTLNVANLFLVRSAERGRELGVRAALGASRGRLVRLHLTEGVVVAVAAGVLGGMVATWLVDGLRALAVGMPRTRGIEVDSAVLLVTAAVTLGVGLVVGGAPALWSGADRLVARLGSGSFGHTAGTGGSRLRAGLVVAQVALATMLLAAGGLLVRSFAELWTTDAGFDVEHVATVSVVPPASRYPDVASKHAFYQELAQRLRARPELEDAALTSFLPFTFGRSVADLTIEGRPPTDGSAELLFVSPPYFRVMGVTLRDGRLFTAADGAGDLPVVVVSQALAARHWPGGDPVGSRIRLEDETWRTVVGVVTDTRQHGLNSDLARQVYVPYDQAGDGWPFGMNVLVRPGPGMDAGAVARVARATVASVDPRVPVAGIQGLADWRSGSVAAPRLRALLVGLFATAGLLLAVIGVYGVIAHIAAVRTREVGIRVALGATRSRIVGELIGRGAVLTGIGLAIGLAGAVGAGRFLEAYLFGIGPADPVTFAAIATLLGAAALAACYLPARRASRMSPVDALRIE